MNQRYYYIRNSSGSCLGGCLIGVFLIILVAIFARAFLWFFGPLIVALIVIAIIASIFRESRGSDQTNEDPYDQYKKDWRNHDESFDRDFQEFDDQDE